MANSRYVADSETIGSARSATEFDTAIGQRIKRRRGVVGVTQWQLADQIGVSFQQLHKYEAGHNRVPAQRLNEIARALGAPLEYFFEEPEDAGNARRTSDEKMIDSQIHELAGLLRELPTKPAREQLIKLVRFFVRDLELGR